MKVYRGNIQEYKDNSAFPQKFIDGIYCNKDGKPTFYQPYNGMILHTGSDFGTLSGPVTIQANKYYKIDGVYSSSEYVKFVEMTEEAANAQAYVTVFDIMQATYTGQDMGERYITATIKHPTPIDFRIGDFVEFGMQSLERNSNHGAVLSPAERFYVYTEPQCKKTARSMSAGDAFEITVKFYPRQYELIGIQMRDFIQQEANADKIIYTGFDTVSFYGGAKELLDRCMACLSQYYRDVDGKGLWKYVLAPALNEEQNNALERFAFSFSGNSVMDAIKKLNDKEGINTTFYINGRTIYVGFKRPFLCSVNAQGAITDNPLNMTYGKTSHLPITLDHGGLYDITKSVGDEMPITKLFAYGAARNLNRYYCADRLHSGRFVNKLMLPSFSDDGETDWIESADGIAKYGVHEGSKNFDEIYPSLRYMTYEDIRGIKYCIKIRTSGLSDDQFEEDGTMKHYNSKSRYPVARVQCYKVTPCTGDNVGRNMLVECQPPEDLVIFVHATGKTVKCVLYGGATEQEALAKQCAAAGKWSDANTYRVPARTFKGSDYIAGSCFCVHDQNFADADGTTYDSDMRTVWYESSFDMVSDSGSLYFKNLEEQGPSLHRIEYIDTFWLTDLYVMGYDGNNNPLYDNQRNFKRDGYSAWAWPRLNDESDTSGSLPVNEVVAVEPIVIADTSDNLKAGRQAHWDIYLRDIGFAIDEQNDFGEMVFVFNTPVISVLDGILAGREFTIDGGDSLNDFQDRVVCAYDEEGALNPNFFYAGDSNNEGVPRQALLNGAVWRIRLNRNDNDSELSSVGLVIPNTDIAMKAGDHVVLLDIYMPDIYIRAAEQRLLREAQWYLDSNDKDNVKYSISFDKVRFNQIPNYALQMREGVMLRMVDEDLNIMSNNHIRTLVEYIVPSKSLVQFYTNENIIVEDEPRVSTYVYWKKNSQAPTKLDQMAVVKSTETEGLYAWSLRVPKSDPLAHFDTSVPMSHNIHISPKDNPGVTFTLFDVETPVGYSDCWMFHFKMYQSSTDMTVSVEIHELVSASHYEKSYYEEGDNVPAICRDCVHFHYGKVYEVVADVNEDLFDNRDVPLMLTPSATDITTRYEITDFEQEEVEDATGVADGYKRYRFKFALPDNFNDDCGYYMAFNYVAPEEVIEDSAVYLVSVVEKDMESNNEVVKYVDFLVSSMTMKITDNTRPKGNENYTSEANKHDRIIDNAPELMYEEISAQIVEQTKVSGWGALRNEVEKTRVETEQMQRSYEMIVNAARQNYQNLLDLKNSIFDPDGTCNEVFLQVMMLQVGADSMNYQLDYTYTTPTGVMSNFSVSGRQTGTANNDRFAVRDADVLHHHVYTKGAVNGGTWEIPGGFSAELAPTTNADNETVWPVYYVCIRCKKDGANNLAHAAWMCTTDQYAVNQDKVPSTGATTNEYGENVSDYWYFNWGILTADDNGHYTLQETRGNAYMYGDNIICGKISTLAGQSFFDLTHGNFVLSQNGPDSQNKYHDGMTYIDGVLTIHGLNDEEGIGKTIKDLGLEEIGGENLYGGLDPRTIDSNDGYIDTGMILENGVKYIISVGSIVGNAYSVIVKSKTGDSYANLGSLVDRGTIGQMQTYKDKRLVVTGDGGSLCFLVGANGAGYYFTLSNIMVQKGNKATSYNTYYHHLTDAMKGSTEIVGGLVMTNLLMLKDIGDANNAPKVVAGMSGLPDDGTQTATVNGQDQSVQSEGVTLWSGGSYQDALKQAMGLVDQMQSILPILLTKTGEKSRIGCFNVLDANTVYVENAARTEKITINTTNGITISKRDNPNDEYVDKVHISGKTISRVDILGERLYGTYNPGDEIINSESATSISSYECEIAELDLSNGIGDWDASFVADKIHFKLACSYYVSKLKIGSISVYIGNKRIVSANGTTFSLQTPSDIEFDVSINSTFSTISSGLYKLRVVFTNVQIEGTGVGNASVSLDKVQLCTRDANNATIHYDADINFQNVKSNDIIEIASNGIQVSRRNGGFIQMLNDDVDKRLYVRMFGLPDENGTSNFGELYMESDGNIKAHL